MTKKIIWISISIAITVFMLIHISNRIDLKNDLLYVVVYGAPLVLIYHIFSLSKWWLGEKTYLAIIRVFEEMEVERRETPAHKYNPIFYIKGKVEEGIEYDIFGWLRKRRENEPLSIAYRRRPGRFTNEQVKMLAQSERFHASLIPDNHSYPNKIFFYGDSHIPEEDGYWECLPSLSEIRRFKYLFKRARLHDETYRYIKD